MVSKHVIVKKESALFISRLEIVRYPHTSKNAELGSKKK